MSGPTPIGIHFITLGCPKNEVDSDRMSALVANSDYELADSLDAADIAVVNTCAFIEPAVNESISLILDLAADWRPEREGRLIVVAGCMPSRYGDELSGGLEEADAFVPVAEESYLLDTIERLTGTEARPVRGPKRLSSAPSAYLQIADGCHRSCSYCTIPSIRGPYRSHALRDIESEARELVDSGAREIVLIGQDTSSWGRDLEDESGSLPAVLRAVAGTEGLEWLRLMYVQPDGISDELLEVMASESKICAYLDMPLQHSAAPILRAMHRSGSAESFLELIGRIRGALPDVVLRTSLIAGFPGETDKDASALADFIVDAAFEYVGVFPYSPEEGTAAAELQDLPSEKERLARAQMLRDTADAVGVAAAAKLVGRKLEVLAEGLDEEGTPMGRWRGQAPEVDGIVLLDRELAPGSLVTAEIVDAYGYDLEGRIVR